jgi:mRNA interferase HicA
LKRRDLERSLKDLGWWFLRPGGSHDVWTNGLINTTVPRHSEIKEMTAKGILNTASKNPPKKS